MKKILAIMLAALLCTALLTGALAEAPVYELGDADWVDGSNYVYIRGDNGYYLATMDGTALTSDEFADIDYSNGLFIGAKRTVEGINDSGLMDETGAELTPFQYADINVLNEYWAVGIVLAAATAENYDYNVIFGDMDYAIIETVDIYNLTSGTCVASLSRSEYKSCRAYGSYINVENRADGTVTTYDAEFNALGTVNYTSSEDLIPAQGIQTFYENGQYGLKDADGNVIMAPAFSSIYGFENGYARVSTGEKRGVIDEAGNVVVPAEYDEINFSIYSPEGVSQYYNAGYFCVEQDGKLGYVAAGGAVTCEPKLSTNILKNKGATAFYTDMEGVDHMLSADGVDTVLDGYTDIYTPYYSSGMFHRTKNADGAYGLIDFHGNEVLPCQYRDVSLSGDGRYVLAEVERGVCQIFELTYPEIAVGAAPAEEAASETEGEAPAASGAAALLDSAILLLNTDAVANANAVVGLLNSAFNELGAESAAGAIINSAINTLQSDPAANGATVVQLLENAKTLL